MSRRTPRTTSFQDLYYGRHRDTNHRLHGCAMTPRNDEWDEDKYKLDVYVPGVDASRDEINTCVNNDGPHSRALPVVVFIHGGGWRRGDRKAWKHYMSFRDTNVLMAFLLWCFHLYGNVGEALASRGIACAIISYPLSKLSGAWMAFEMLTSYVMSAAFILAIGVFLSLTISLLSIVLDVSLTFAYASCFGSFSEATFLFFVTFNHIIAILMTANRRQYKLTWGNLAVLWVCMLVSVGVGILSHSYGKLFGIKVLFLTTLIWTQGILLLRRYQQPPVNSSDQLEAVNDAILFVKQLGKDNSLYDGDNVYVMGHSAGGHLAAMLALRQLQPQNTIGQRDLHIKGVISISGVFDLCKIGKSFLKPLYLHPTFGKNHSDWLDVSPIHVLRSGNKEHVTAKSANSIPRFFLVTAERDLHLHSDATELCRELKGVGGRCVVRTICPSNHFTIVWDFKKKSGDSSTKLTEMCADFIFTRGEFDY